MINGWALTGARSSRLHAVPMPTDLGGYGRAVCGKRPSTRSGWVERDGDRSTPADRCGACVAYAEASEVPA